MSSAQEDQEQPFPIDCPCPDDKPNGIYIPKNKLDQNLHNISWEAEIGKTKRN